MYSRAICQCPTEDLSAWRVHSSTALGLHESRVASGSIEGLRLGAPLAKREGVGPLVESTATTAEAMIRRSIAEVGPLLPPEDFERAHSKVHIGHIGVILHVLYMYSCVMSGKYFLTPPVPRLSIGMHQGVSLAPLGRRRGAMTLIRLRENT